MLRPRVTPSLVPDSDVTVHIVLDRIGKDVRVYREVAETEADLETLIDDILTGQYYDPYRIIAFNTAEGWSRDVTEDVARDVLKRAVRENRSLQGEVRDFVERETGEEVPSSF
jgi:hypothetical protein